MADAYRVELPLTMRDRLKEKARELSVPVAKLVEQALEMVLGGQVQPIIQPREVTPEDAGDLLLGFVEEGQASLIRDLCREHGRAAYEYLLGYAYLAHERGETATMVGESVLARSAPAKAADLMPDTALCEYDACRKPFHPVRRGQRYCPDPEDGEGCGRKASLATLHAHRASRTRGVDNQGAPKQQPIDVYRRAAMTTG